MTATKQFVSLSLFFLLLLSRLPQVAKLCHNNIALIHSEEASNLPLEEGPNDFVNNRATCVSEEQRCIMSWEEGNAGLFVSLAENHAMRGEQMWEWHGGGRGKWWLHFLWCHTLKSFKERENETNKLIEYLDHSVKYLQGSYVLHNGSLNCLQASV